MSSNPSTPRTPSAFYAAFVDWARTDGRTWIYLFKALAACFLALGIAMKLDLPQPRTAMTTVFIVMQPQSGMVFAKSFYRICGTLIGLGLIVTRRGGLKYALPFGTLLALGAAAAAVAGPTILDWYIGLL